MKRPLAALPVLIALALAGCGVFDATTGEDARAAAQATVDTLDAERAALAAQIDEADRQLAAIEAAGATDGAAADLAGELRADIARASRVLEQLDRGLADARAAIDAAPVYDDAAAQGMGDAAAVMTTVGAAVPGAGPWLALGGVALSLAAAWRERLKRAEALEAVRDFAKGFDAWHDAEIINGGKEQAEAAKRTIRGALSERTRKVVARSAEHPLGAGG